MEIQNQRILAPKGMLLLLQSHRLADQCPEPALVFPRQASYPAVGARSLLLAAERLLSGEQAWAWRSANAHSAGCVPGLLPAPDGSALCLSFQN